MFAMYHPSRSIDLGATCVPANGWPPLVFEGSVAKSGHLGDVVEMLSCVNSLFQRRACFRAR